MKALLFFLATLIPQIPPGVPPPAPIDLGIAVPPAFNGTGGYQVEIYWAELANNATFNVYRGANGATPTLFNAKPLLYGQLHDFYVHRTYTYSYYITAVVNGIESAPSVTVSITVPKAAA